MKRTSFYLIIFSVILCIGQLTVGTDILVAFLFSIAIFFGLAATFATGRWNSLFGLLNFSLILKFLLFGVVVKIFFLQPADHPLRAPFETAMVCAFGFAGVMIGTVIQTKFRRPKRHIIHTINDKYFYLTLYIFSMIVGYGSWLYVYITRQGITDVESTVGGVFGVLGQFGDYKNMSISAAIYYLWASKSQRLLSHGLVIFTLVLSILVAIYSTSKQEMLKPLIFLILTVVSIKGVSYRPLWIIIITGLVTYTNFVYPFSQYIRHAGGREGTTSERIALMSEVVSKMVEDGEYREDLVTKTSKNKDENYLPVAGASLGRFAMVAEADRLIAASNSFEDTGWETINWGFSMILPRFINPDKPIFAPNNYLGHIAGDISGNDYTTQVSYGFMANLYNAFGFTGVFFGSTIVTSLLYYWLSLFFGNATKLDIWIILVFSVFDHILTEQAVGSIIASIWFPVLTLVPFFLAKKIGEILYNKSVVAY